MDKIVITNALLGICGMQVCVDATARDAEILAVCNTLNPSGTMHGWGTVVRDESQSFFVSDNGDPSDLPVTCADDKNRLHLVILC